MYRLARHIGGRGCVYVRVVAGWERTSAAVSDLDRLWLPRCQVEIRRMKRGPRGVASAAPGSNPAVQSGQNMRTLSSCSYEKQQSRPPADEMCEHVRAPSGVLRKRCGEQKQQRRADARPRPRYGGRFPGSPLALPTTSGSEGCGSWWSPRRLGLAWTTLAAAGSHAVRAVYAASEDDTMQHKSTCMALSRCGGHDEMTPAPRADAEPCPGCWLAAVVCTWPRRGPRHDIDTAPSVASGLRPFLISSPLSQSSHLSAPSCSHCQHPDYPPLDYPPTALRLLADS